MDKWINSTTAHAIGGGLIVLIFSPVFALLGFPGYLGVVGLVLVWASIKEMGDHFKWWAHEDSNFRQAINDIAEWVFGAVVFALFIGITKFLT